MVHNLRGLEILYTFSHFIGFANFGKLVLFAKVVNTIKNDSLHCF